MRERLTHYGPSPSKVGVCRRGSEDGEEVLRGDGDQGDAIGTGVDFKPWATTGPGHQVWAIQAF